MKTSRLWVHFWRGAFCVTRVCAQRDLHSFLFDRKADAVTAAAASVTAIFKNPAAMAVWAALIVLLIGFGLATFYVVGLVVTGPLIGPRHVARVSRSDARRMSESILQRMKRN